MRCPDPVLSLAGVTGARGSFEVRIEALTLGPGETAAIVGPSGVGKSTILDMLACILRPVSAERFDVAGEDAARLWQSDDRDGLRRLRAARLGYVLQTGGLAPFLSVADNVAMPFWRDGVPDGGAVAAILARLGIAEAAPRIPARISVGQRQRAAIARALVREPALVLADEPTAALDQDTANDVMALLTGTCRERGAALVVVTHDRALAEAHGVPLVECVRTGPGRAGLSA